MNGPLSVLLVLSAMLLFACSFATAESVEATSLPATTSAPASQPAAPMLVEMDKVSFKLEDGQLRYICYDGKEVLRRVYFAVRDSNWDTAPTVISNMVVSPIRNKTTITFSAACQNKLADYSWKGEVVVTRKDITFTATGSANKQFNSPRVGLCILVGGQQAGTQFRADTQADPIVDKFPVEISPRHIVDKFSKLTYAAGATEVTVKLADGLMDMEDQRNYGDSSYKAYAAMGRNATRPGTELTQKLTISFAPAAEPSKLYAMPTTGKMPALVKDVAKERVNQSFGSISGSQGKLTSREWLAWSYTPAMHLFDDDMLMENPANIVFQALTARAVSGNAKLQVVPLTIDAPYPGHGKDERNAKPFAGAWAVVAMKYLALAKVDEACFELGDGAAPVLAEMAKFSGKAVKDVPITTCGGAQTGRPALVAFLVEDEKANTLWVANTTSSPQQLKLKDLGYEPTRVQFVDGLAAATVNARPAPSMDDPVATAATGIVLKPYQVVKVTVAK